MAFHGPCQVAREADGCREATSQEAQETPQTLQALQLQESEIARGGGTAERQEGICVRVHARPKMQFSDLPTHLIVLLWLLDFDRSQEDAIGRVQMALESTMDDPGTRSIEERQRPL